MNTPSPRLKFAGRQGKTTLYKFKPCSDHIEKARVREILIEHKVYFSRPSQLNDPFDLSPVFAVSRDREALIQDAERHRAKRRPPYTPKESGRFRQWLRTADHAEIAKTLRDGARGRLEDYWVFSLAGNREHPMLWSHYARGHTGLSIHFLADSSSPFSGALNVTYSPERPVIPIPITLSEHDTAERVSLRKGDFWRYEEEYRLIRYPNVDYSNTDLEFEGQHARFPARLITGITVGSRMAAEDMDAICAIAAQHVPVLPVWQAQEQDTYDFQFVQLLG